MNKSELLEQVIVLFKEFEAEKKILSYRNEFYPGVYRGNKVYTLSLSPQKVFWITVEFKETPKTKYLTKGTVVALKNAADLEQLKTVCLTEIEKTALFIAKEKQKQEQKSKASLSRSFVLLKQEPLQNCAVT